MKRQDKLRRYGLPDRARHSALSLHYVAGIMIRYLNMSPITFSLQSFPDDRYKKTLMSELVIASCQTAAQISYVKCALVSGLFLELCGLSWALVRTISSAVVKCLFDVSENSTEVVQFGILEWGT